MMRGKRRLLAEAERTRSHGPPRGMPSWPLCGPPCAQTTQSVEDCIPTQSVGTSVTWCPGHQDLGALRVLSHGATRSVTDQRTSPRARTHQEIIGAGGASVHRAPDFARRKTFEGAALGSFGNFAWHKMSSARGWLRSGMLRGATWHGPEVGFVRQFCMAQNVEGDRAGA